MRNTERIVDVYIPQFRQRASKILIVQLLFRIKTQILKHNDVPVMARIQPPLDILTHTIIELDDRTFHELGEMLRDRIQTKRVIHTFRPSQMREQDDDGVHLQEISDRLQGLPDPCVINDLPILQRYIVIHTDKHALATHIEITDGTEHAKRFDDFL